MAGVGTRFTVPVPGWREWRTRFGRFRPISRHPGWFEQAGDGSLLLDEVGELSPRMQAALLRVLESGEYRRVGGDRPRQARCRVLAASNRDLAAEATAGRFRADLLHRLQRLVIHLPPLREHPEDVPAIALHLLRHDSLDPEGCVLLPDLVDELCGRPWPGNVRQLRNELDRMRLLASECGRYDRAAFLAANGSVSAAEPAASRDRTAGERRQRLRRLFGQRGDLRRVEVMRLLGISPQTATADLRALIATGEVAKVMPSAAPISHFFRWSGPTKPT